MTYQSGRKEQLYLPLADEEERMKLRGVGIHRWRFEVRSSSPVSWEGTERWVITCVLDDVAGRPVKIKPAALSVDKCLMTEVKRERFQVDILV